ncbi:hypothetical protein WDU94_004078 [Cyamophila willieti]
MQVFMLTFAFLYPAYLSYKSLKNKNTVDQFNLMTYWIVFAVFRISEYLADFIFAMWLPFYYELKMLVIIWLLSPATRGSTVMYTNFMYPFLTTHEKQIEEYVVMMRTKACDGCMYLGSMLINAVVSAFNEANLRSSESFFLNVRRGGGYSRERGRGNCGHSHYDGSGDDETTGVKIQLIEDEE